VQPSKVACHKRVEKGGWWWWTMCHHEICGNQGAGAGASAAANDDVACCHQPGCYLHNNVEEQSTAKPGHLSVRMYLCIFVSLYLCITEPRDVYVHLQQQQQQQQHQQSINPRTQAPVDSCAILCINAWA